MPASMIINNANNFSIIDAGNTYVIQTFADNALVDGGREVVIAPASGDLEFTISAMTFGLDLRQ